MKRFHRNLEIFSKKYNVCEGYETEYVSRENGNKFHVVAKEGISGLIGLQKQILVRHYFLDLREPNFSVMKIIGDKKCPFVLKECVITKENVFTMIQCYPVLLQ